ncbi:hypothetical protein SAMN05421736_108115 [Evansella caseinilytica]|uniref:Uncharacterized protein n=1 Tax=Evansella caseinilytica TaxID=1503961 RepID=A0A1H3RI81_9BACI|nr:hypothetical protein SAMN05421736_108115 [Evansella caseinilytica]
MEGGVVPPCCDKGWNWRNPTNNDLDEDYMALKKERRTVSQ